MPFKSEAQRRKFAELVKKGKMDKSTYEEWNVATPKDIPERLGNKSKTIGKVKKVKVK